MLSLEERQQLVRRALAAAAAARDYWHAQELLDGLIDQGYRGAFVVHAASGRLELPPDAAADCNWSAAADPPSSSPEAAPSHAINPALLPPPPLTILDQPADDIPDAAFRARWP